MVDGQGPESNEGRGLKDDMKTGQTEKTLSFTDMLAQLEDPEVIARIDAARSFLQSRVFRRLNNVKPAFDSPLIVHFHAAEFLEVVRRCTALGIFVIGVEIFTHRGWPVDIEIACEDSNSNSWCFSLVRRYRKRGDLFYCATYEVPERALALLPDSLKSVDHVV
jgi:hypothetical protein